MSHEMKIYNPQKKNVFQCNTSTKLWIEKEVYNKTHQEGKEDCLPGLLGSTGHHGGTVTGTLLTSRDAASDKEEALGLQFLCAADGVGKVRVASVDDDVALLEEGKDLVDKVIDSLAGLDEHHDFAGTLELLAELLDRVGADDVGALGLVGEEVIDLGDGSVVGADGESVVVHVQDQVLALSYRTINRSYGRGHGAE